MSIADSLLPEFDNETKITRSLVERVPDDKADWKPHPKSMSMGQLAMHCASLTSWAQMTLAGSEFDMNPVGGSTFVPPTWQSNAATLAALDKGAAEARAAIAATSDAEMMKDWSLKNGRAVMFTLPKAAVLRAFVFSHIIHHRGQLSVYLRLNDIPVPRIYGPSADEQ